MGHKVLGIEVSSKFIKMAIVRNGKKPELLYCNTVASPVEQGLGTGLSDEENDITNIGLWVKKTLSKNKKVSSGIHSLVICVNNQQTVVRPITVPILPKKQIPAAVEFEVSQSFPGVGKTHAIAFKEYRRDKKEKKIYGIVSFAPRKVVESSKRIIDFLGFKRASIDVAANSSAKAYFAFAEGGRQDKTTFLCDIGAAHTQFSIVNKNQVLHSRQIPEGDNGLKEIFHKKIGIIPERFEDIRSGIIQMPYLTEEEFDEIFRSVYGNIIEQIQQTIDFYHSSSEEDNPVQQVVFTGAGAIFPELEGFLKDNLSQPASIIQPVDGIKFDHELITRSFSAIGAAIREDL